MVGLTSAEAARLLAQYGPNEIAKKRPSTFVKLIKALASPASVMLVVASALSFYIGQQFDGWFILALLVLNVGMTLWHTRKADNALEALRSQLSVEAKVMRDGAWMNIPSRELVAGDVIECGVSALVTADTHIDQEVNLEINEAVLTGESLPKEKKVGDTAYSGSVVVTGNFTGTVSAIGNQAFFGKIAAAGKEGKRKSSMEREILSISRYLIIASLIAVAILTVVFILDGQPLASILILDLSLLIAGIPVSLPTVMTLIISIGALAVAAKKALVRRLSSLEDFANVTLLLTDKTGTLTENKISVERVHAYTPFSEDDVRVYASMAAEPGSTAIDYAIVAAGGPDVSPQHVLQTIPADSTRKRTTTLLERDGVRYLVSVGTPPIIERLCSPLDGLAASVHRDTEDAAKDGSRAIAVALKKDPSGIEDEHGMSFIGMLVLADPLRADAKETLRFLKNEGVNAIMVTGDTKETAAHVAVTLGLMGNIVRTKDLDFANLPADIFATTAAFAEVSPEDKLALVTAAQQRYTVAATGDGVNDLPAVRKADVGIAVANAVDALKGTADIVLLDSGISVMQTALTEARKIFFRLYNYSVYRISESFRLIVTALVLGLIIKGFPLTPVQIILLAFLNDIPIITLAFDRVKRVDRPADVVPRERFTLGTLFGLVGVAESLVMYFLLADVFHLPLAIIQTAFFLKLTVSGHMLVYVAHTKERWWKFLPAKSIIWATSITQAAATALAVFGIFVTAIPLSLAAFVWIWTFLWMQMNEGMKTIESRFDSNPQPLIVVNR
ncbi:MAG TPA: HAD-IC family P-type ATPase [Candidatus Paceibacterota bacterium]|nr:HAD-IC family P-type ATPase [Candidatus Paceibacterota bacterium]